MAAAAFFFLQKTVFCLTIAIIVSAHLPIIVSRAAFSSYDANLVIYRYQVLLYFSLFSLRPQLCILENLFRSSLLGSSGDALYKLDLVMCLCCGPASEKQLLNPKNILTIV